jgi:hypothetical protein
MGKTNPFPLGSSWVGDDILSFVLAIFREQQIRRHTIENSGGLKRAKSMAVGALGLAFAQDRRLGAGIATTRRPAAPQAQSIAALPREKRRTAPPIAGRRLCVGPRGRAPDNQHAAFRRADSRRHRHV